MIQYLINFKYLRHTQDTDNYVDKSIRGYQSGTTTAPYFIKISFCNNLYCLVDINRFNFAGIKFYKFCVISQKFVPYGNHWKTVN